MFKNAIIFRIAQLGLVHAEGLLDRLDAGRFVECSPTQTESAGWVPPRGEKHGALLENIGGQLMLRLQVERKAVPAAAVKDALEKRLDSIEQETGRRPKGKHAKELKEEVTQDLLPRAFPKRSDTLVWVSPAAGFVVIDAGSLKAADRIVTLLVEILGGGLVLRLLTTQTSPAVAMAEWLKTKEAPAGFTVDRECQLQQPDSEKAAVKYSRHTLDIDEVAEHIAQGKVPTQVALTWNSRASFVLTDGLALKKIKLLDVVMDGKGDDASGFDADVAIATGELAHLLPDLVAALGGESPGAGE